MKKGQVAIFIIIGVVLLMMIIALLIFLHNRNSNMPKIAASGETNLVKRYMDECLKKKADEALALLGAQGGYIISPNASLKFGGSYVTYLYSDKKKRIPSIAFVESELEYYLNTTAMQCFANTSIKNAVLEIKSVTVSVKNNSVSFNAQVPVEINEGDFTYRFGEWKYEAPVKIGLILAMTDGYLDKIANNPDFIDVSYFDQSGLNLNLLPADKETLVFSIEDLSKQSNYRFVFAAKPDLKNAPKIVSEDMYKLKENEEFSQKLGTENLEDTSLEFSDDSALFDITKDGKIIFVPEIPGTYYVTITATDDSYNRAQKKIKFVIDE